MKKFLTRFCLLMLVFSLLCVTPAVYFDPFNVFHWKDARITGVEPNKNYIKTRYVLANPDAFDGFIFGSSRVGSLHVEKITDGRVYNMTYASGLPREQLRTLQIFLDGGVKVKRVFMGIDELTFTASAESHLTSPYRIPYEYLRGYRRFLTYADPALLIQGRQYLHFGELPKYGESFYRYGWWCDYSDGGNLSSDLPEAVPRSVASMQIRKARANHPEVEAIRACKALCDENGIEFILFVNPLIAEYYQEAVENGLFEYLKEIVEFTDFYNFCGMNCYTVDPANYADTSHYDAYLGDKMLDVMCNGAVYDDYDRGFGWHVTKENIDDLIEILSMDYVVE